MYKINSNGKSNRSFRTGCFFYGRELDASLASTSNEDSYKYKSALIESTALDLVGQLRRLAYSKVVCIASHRYEFANRIAPDGRVREPHIHVLYFSASYANGTHQYLRNFFASRQFPGKRLII
jgi:hypothetical protein